MKKILIIEDDDSIRENIRQLLTRFGYEVYEAENGLKGVELSGEIMPELIVCDIMMPDLDGYEVLENLNRQTETAAIPFIFLTGRSEMSDLRYGMGLGADDYIIKPFKAGDLLRSIETRLKKKETILVSEQRVQKENTRNNQLNSNSVIMAGTPPEILKISSIVYVNACGVYSEVHCSNGKTKLVRKLLKEWEAILPEEQFLRIHNSTVINLEYLERVEKWFNYSLRVYMRGIKEPLEVSKRYTPRVKASLSF